MTLTNEEKAFLVKIGQIEAEPTTDTKPKPPTTEKAEE